jgi:hypothetical protein
VEQPALLLATVNTMHVEHVQHGAKPMQQVVHLNEKKVYPQNRDDNKDVWVLDTGAINHMTGRREALASLDTTV